MGHYWRTPRTVRETQVRCHRSGKLCHDSYRAAAKYMKKLGQIARRATKGRSDFRPYRCKHCDSWHLGSHE